MNLCSGPPSVCVCEVCSTPGPYTGLSKLVPGCSSTPLSLVEFLVGSILVFPFFRISTTTKITTRTTITTTTSAAMTTPAVTPAADPLLAATSFWFSEPILSGSSASWLSSSKLSLSVRLPAPVSSSSGPSLSDVYSSLSPPFVPSLVLSLLSSFNGPVWKKLQIYSWDCYENIPVWQRVTTPTKEQNKEGSPMEHCSSALSVPSHSMWEYPIALA